MFYRYGQLNTVALLISHTYTRFTALFPGLPG